MVSQKLIKSYDFETIQDYFNYIVDSYVNGQKQQAKELYNSLSIKQIKHFAAWYLIFYYFDAADNNTTVEQESHQFINYLNG